MREKTGSGGLAPLDFALIRAGRAAPLLEEGNAFIAVGALHLIGEKGLVELIRKQGYVMTRLH
ncbi:MAG: TraB/GumN family protein [Pararhizobium sp.]